MNQEATPISIVTGSRLHFGLTRIKPKSASCLNGIGVMIDAPCTKLEIRPAAEFGTDGSDRLTDFAQSWSLMTGKALPRCQLNLVDRPPEHSGFGSGTQLAHAVANGLSQFCGQPLQMNANDVRAVAENCERGRRSMIGSYGFAHGGLIVDGNDGAGQTRLVNQVDLPYEWRVLVVVAEQANKKFGVQEQAAFANIQTEAIDPSGKLEQLISDEIIPAAKLGNFDTFTDSVFEYGKISGSYYVPVQGGIYNGPVITEVVDALVRLGAKGVGQSSWGPAVFAWCRNQDQANDLMLALPQHIQHAIKMYSSAVRNRPADIS